jgi:hypothetical protein
MLLSFRDEISALISGVGKAFGCLFCEALYLYRAKNHLRLILLKISCIYFNLY